MKEKMKSFFASLGHFFKRIFLSFKEGLKHDQKRIAKYVICFAAILHLLLSNTQIQAINKLSNEICGIYMFMFVLIGFACLFNAIRLKEPSRKKIVFPMIMLILVMVFGGLLVYVYIDALMHQRNLLKSFVINGMILSIVIIALYLFGLVETIIAHVSYLKSQKKEKLSKETKSLK